jgi:hypothetical protein
MHRIEKTASGNLQLVIKDPIGSENFFVLAKNWVKQHDATFISEAFNFDTQLWEIKYQGELFYLATDVWSGQFTLESKSEAGNAIIERLLLEENSK